MGKFYEFFHMDATIGVKELGLLYMKVCCIHCYSLRADCVCIIELNIHCRMTVYIIELNIHCGMTVYIIELNIHCRVIMLTLGFPSERMAGTLIRC